MSDAWEVIKADPLGFWLVPVGSKDPTEWAWMEEKDPAEEIERLRKTIECVEHEVALVYDHLTGGKISKCNTAARYVIEAVEERQNSWTDELIAEAMQEKNAEIERLREHVAELEKALRLLRDTVHEIAEWEKLDGFAEAYDMCRALAVIRGEDE